LNDDATDPLEPRDKLDTLAVNGTEDGVLVWEAIQWRLHEDNVRRLRRRIFKAAQEQDLAKVRGSCPLILDT
jgi:RNA-directed DNA polymerase